MITYNGITYATEQSDCGEQLFKILKNKNSVKFYIDKDSGFGINQNGVPFQFHRHTRDNGKTYLWYQYTLRYDEQSFRKYAEQNDLIFM